MGGNILIHSARTLYNLALLKSHVGQDSPSGLDHHLPHPLCGQTLLSSQSTANTGDQEKVRVAISLET